MKKSAKVIIFILIVIIIALCAFIIKDKFKKPVSKEPVKKELKTNIPISSNEKTTKEENFTGTFSVITGEGILVREANSYIEKTLASFKEMADTDVPSIRKKFGSDSPTSNYEINLKATYAPNERGDSIIIEESMYTGGANSNSSYKVFTASHKVDKILSLEDIIISSKQGAFMDFVKKSLINWRPEGSKEQVVFDEEVKNLNFSNLDDWSFGKYNLIVYFDKYQIGPGALGAIPFSLPYSKIQDFLVK